MYLMSVYWSPAYHMCDFAKTMTRILKEFRYLQTCVVGDINEDILLTSENSAVLCFVLKDSSKLLQKM